MYSVWLRAGRPGDRGSIPGRGQRIFPLASVSRPSLRPTPPPVQWVPGVLSQRIKRSRGVTLTIHPHLVPRSRMSRSYTPSPPSAFMACSGTTFNYTAYTGKQQHRPQNASFASKLQSVHHSRRWPPRSPSVCAGIITRDII
jgi:hypothetical protein